MTTIGAVAADGAAAAGARPNEGTVPHARSGATRGVRAVAGVVLTLLSVLPVYRLLARPDTGLAGQATVEMAGTYGGLAAAGLAFAAIVALLSAKLAPAAALKRGWSRAERALGASSAARFGGIVALVAAGAAALFNRVVLDGQPNLVDAMSQLVHARYLAEGMLAGPASPLGAFWHIQQTVVTEAGWVSQYPPMHVALLAAGFVVGAPWLVGPALLGAAIFLTALAADRLLPERRAVARVGVALAAVSPFLIAHAGAYMSHTTAAAFAALAVYATARVRDDGVRWSVLVGAALGALLATRPLFAVAIGVVVAVAVVAGVDGPATRRARAAAVAAAGIVAGALPLVLLLFAYNATLFGQPFRFGYEAALGPDGGLGFGVDPWGNTYGLAAAAGYTSAELQGLGVALLEVPLPLVALVGVWLAAARRLERGAWIFVGWALAPLAANAFYWHHGLFMGPRMLNETAPAWCVLAALAAAWLVRAAPVGSARTFGYDARAGTTVALVAAAMVGVAVLGPMRLWSYRQDAPAALAATASLDGPSLVFVHGAWSGRVAMRLAASGMRLDSVETALRQNSTCAAHRLADAREAGAPDPAGLDFERRAAPRNAGDPLARLRAVALPGGARVRVADGEPWTEACTGEANSDMAGIADITPLLWQADLPGLPARGALFARDLGMAANARLIAAMPERTPYRLVLQEAGGARVEPYGASTASLEGEAR